MAAVTSLVATPDTGATPNASGAFTPVADDLLFAFIVTSGSSGSAGTLVSSANGITWTVLTPETIFGAGAHTLNFFVANQLVGPSPVSMTVTWTPTDPGTGTVIFVGKATGMTRVGLDAVRQWQQQNNRTTGVPNPAFGAAVLTGNPTLAAVGLEGVSANTAVPPSGWTERGDTGYATPTTGGEWSSRDSGFTGTTVTWTSVASAICGAMVVELDSSSPPAPSTDRVHHARRKLQAVRRAATW